MRKWIPKIDNGPTPGSRARILTYYDKVPVWEGQIIGENPRKEDLPVNPTKAKQLDNMRASGSDKGIQLAPPQRFSLERAIEYITSDELVEATPNHLRLRKRILDSNIRRKLAKAEKK